MAQCKVKNTIRQLAEQNVKKVTLTFASHAVALAKAGNLHFAMLYSRRNGDFVNTRRYTKGVGG